MRIIKIEANELGGHDNQTIFNATVPVPEGWAIIPDDMEIPSTFPFVDLTVRDGIVTEMREGVMPPTPEPEYAPSTDEVLDALLGVTE